MIGDCCTVGNDPGHGNYIAGNIVKWHATGPEGAVPAGFLGSSGNTIVEKNCFPQGIQLYAYNGNPIDFTVRNNVISGGWGGTNINSTDCSLVPK